MKHLNLALICSLVIALTSSAKEVTLLDHKLTFEIQLKKIDSGHKGAVAGLLKSYGKSLEQLVVKTQADGDLDALLAVNRELARLRKENAGPSGAPDKLPNALAALHKKYHDAERGIRDSHNAKKKRLTEHYVKVLEGRVRKLTKDGKIEDALAARAEKERAEAILVGGHPSAPGDTPPRPPVQPQAGSGSDLSAALKKGLLLHHDFNAVSFDKVQDQSDQGHDAILHNVDWVADGRGKKNGALHFDGKNSYVELGDILNDLDYPVTIALWVKVDEFPKTWDPAMVFESDKREGVYSGFWVNAGKSNSISMNFGDGKGTGPGNRKSFYSSKELAVGTWLHMTAISKARNATTIYIDGKVIQTSSGGGGKIERIGHSRKPAVIGRDFLGMLDDVMLWDRALTDEEAKQLYALTRGADTQ